MRIALDMQACQTESRHRGIGRYSMELTRALLLGGNGSDEYILGLDRNFPGCIPSLRDELGSAGARAGAFGYAYPRPVFAPGSPGEVMRPAAAAMIRQQYAEYSADVIHVHSLFEDAIEPIGGLGRLAGLPGTASSVTLYDLIPAVFPDQYLSTDSLRAWYAAKLRELRMFDRILCISEATKLDGMRFLDLPEDRFHVIHAGVEESFFQVPAGFDPQALKRRFGIDDRFVLYTGNGDARKNLPGAIAAFAAIPPDRRVGVQLVLNQVGDEREVRSCAARAGLAARELVITGRVDDAELNGLLRCCDVFFFPSLYEGFGLPVLEAMACGAVAVAANNSSLPEVVGMADALFDAGSLDATVQCLLRALEDDGFRARLRETGLAKAKSFTWERTARLARSAWQQAGSARCAERAAAPATARLNVALVTPVPPERTGIADYVTELLPALGECMNVDVYTSADVDPGAQLTGVRALYPWQALPEQVGRYDQVVYQFGNSPFHTHMLDLLDDVPGMVVLHDLYLSSMMAHADLSEGSHPGLFSAELDRSHGRGSVALLDTEGAEAAKQKYPCSRRVLERADGVIVHSSHSMEMLQGFYPHLLRGPLLPVPMPLGVRSPLAAEERERIRASLGVEGGQTLVTSFGFMADTKLNLEMLAAFADPRLAGRADLLLVFVGDPGGGAYAQQVGDAIADHPMRDRIRITGFVDADAYGQYLQAADIAIQLRQLSRGETSKAVYDCMANGIPLLVNDYASFSEIPDHAAHKVSASAAPGEIVDQLEVWLANPAARLAQGESGRDYVRSTHAPRHVAELYRDAISLSVQSREQRDGSALAEEIARGFLAEVSSAPVELGPIAAALGSVAIHSVSRIFVDVTELAAVDYGTGIQRVVRNVVRELALGEDGSRRCVPVTIEREGPVAPAPHFLEGKLGIRTPLPAESYSPAAADVLFLLDSNWTHPERFDRGVGAMRAAGGQVLGMVYDLIPILHPQYCVGYMPETFAAWLRYMVANCDGLVCISGAVATELRDWIVREEIPHRPGLRIGHAWLGSDVEESSAASADASPSSKIRAAMGEGEGEGAVLMVGTVEPRKRHDLALDAFELAWKGGSEQRLVIIGKQGWNVDELTRRIQGHRQLGKRLFWLQGASDVDLNFAYGRASRVLQASDAEGFGLPIVEAARFGKPLLLSDIPVFREIAGDGASYFKAGDAQSLRALLEGPDGPRPDTVADTTWAECAGRVIGMMKGHHWEYRLP